MDSIATFKCDTYEFESLLAKYIHKDSVQGREPGMEAMEFAF